MKCRYNGCTADLPGRRQRYCPEHQAQGQLDIKRKTTLRSYWAHDPGRSMPCMVAGCPELVVDARYCAKHSLQAESGPAPAPDPALPKNIFRDDDRPRAFVLEAEQW